MAATATSRCPAGAGNAGDNVLNGMGGVDTLIGGLGRDALDVGADAVKDTLVFNSVAESTGVFRDSAMNLNFGQDRLDFSATPTALTAVNAGNLNAATFNTDLAAAADALFDAGGAIEAVLFDPSGGGLNVAGVKWLVIDANNDGSYVAGQDYVLQIHDAVAELTLANFL